MTPYRYVLEERDPGNPWLWRPVSYGDCARALHAGVSIQRAARARILDKHTGGAIRCDKDCVSVELWVNSQNKRLRRGPSRLM